MTSSSRRPLILKRRKLSLSHSDSSSIQVRDEPSRGSPEKEQARTSELDTNRQEHVVQRILPGIEIIDHPTMTNAQVVDIPASAGIQNILETLMTRGKESVGHGPNKFILISGESSNPQMDSRAFYSENQHILANNERQREEKYSRQSSVTMEESIFCGSESLSLERQEKDGNGSEEKSCSLDSSLTNIQWLGKMSSSELSPCSVKKETEKENQTPKHKTIKVEGSSVASSSTSSWQESFTERPPYSYMAMIQFAINSTEKKRMTLKDIYTWIEDHFPYFKHVAKPGWKNTVRHNLSLHDMFVRETSANGKISFWTIQPEANRYLTIDQVFKQQKRHTVDLQKNAGGVSSCKTEPRTTGRKMKPLLPRVNSYLVPIQFPVCQSLIFPPSSKMSVPTANGASETMKKGKQVRIAPKMLPSAEEPALFSSANSIKEEICSSDSLSPFTSDHSTKDDSCQISRAFPSAITIKEKNDTFYSKEWVFPPALSVKEESTQLPEELNVCLPDPSVEQNRQFSALKLTPQNTLDTMLIKRRERHKTGKSRRKQHLSQPCSEGPVIQSSTASSDSFKHNLSFGQETLALGNMSQLSCFQGEDGPFKTPIKKMLNKLPAASTPSRTSVATPSFLAFTDTQKLAPFGKETTDLDFSPVRTLPLLSLHENVDLLGLQHSPNTPPRQSLCDSSHVPLLNEEPNAMVSRPLTSFPSKHSPSELQASVLSENRSLMEGLVLDTMNDSLSKILLDVSFPALEDDSLGTDLSWSRLISELK